MPHLFNLALTKNRNCFLLNACIAKRKPFIAKFKVSHHTGLSGRHDQMEEEHLNLAQNSKKFPQNFQKFHNSSNTQTSLAVTKDFSKSKLYPSKSDNSKS